MYERYSSFWVSSKHRYVGRRIVQDLFKGVVGKCVQRYEACGMTRYGQEQGVSDKSRDHLMKYGKA